MKKDTELTAVGRQYAEAYEAHYTKKSFYEALKLYNGVMTDYPNEKEAKYSRAQIQNIVNAVVPKQVLCDAQLELALSYVKNGAQPDIRPAGVTPLTPELPG